VVGYAAVLKMPGITPTDSIAMEMSLKSLPLGLTGLLFSATLAAAMSSCEILILNAGLQCATDIIAPFTKMKDEAVTKLAKILVIPFALIIVIVSVTKPKTLVGMLLMTYGWLVQLFPIIFGMFFWKRGTKQGAAAGLISGTVVSILFSKVMANPLGIHAGIWGLAINIILFVVVSLLTSPPPEANIAPYFNLEEYKEEAPQTAK
jgi:SSS family solute:Na+ symporter